MRTESITTHDIRLGDRIVTDGMFLLVDREPHQTRHPVDNEGGITRATSALIVNWDELVQRAETDKWIAGFIVSMVRGDLACGEITEPRWTIQGNGWAHWARVVEARLTERP